MSNSSTEISAPGQGAAAESSRDLPGSIDRIELMNTFVRIVEAGSLSAAARQLGTTQPTISRRLKMLEHYLGLNLLQRSTHTIGLTIDGQRCYERIKGLLDSWAAMESDLRGARDEPQGVLKVVAPHAFGQEKLIGPLTEYLQRYPQMSVEWYLHDDRSIHDFIGSGIDCAIQVGDVKDLAMVAIKLAAVPRIVVASPGLLGNRPAPDTPSALAELPWLALRTFYQTDIQLRHAKTGEIQHIDFTPRLSTDSLYALKSAVLNGLGVGVGSSWVMTEELANGRLVQLSPQWQAEPLPVSVVYPYARFYPARLRCFVEIMKTALPGIVGG